MVLYIYVLVCVILPYLVAKSTP